MGPYDYRGRSSILFGKEGRRKRMARSDSGHFPLRRAAGSSGRTHWTTTTAPAAANDCSFGVSSFFNAFMMLAAPAHDGLARWDPMGEGEGGHDGIDYRGLTWMDSVTRVPLRALSLPFTLCLAFPSALSFFAQAGLHAYDVALRPTRVDT